MIWLVIVVFTEGLKHDALQIIYFSTFAWYKLSIFLHLHVYVMSPLFFTGSSSILRNIFISMIYLQDFVSDVEETSGKHRCRVHTSGHTYNTAFSVESADDAIQKAAQMNLYMQDAFPVPPTGMFSNNPPHEWKMLTIESLVKSRCNG